MALELYVLPSSERVLERALAYIYTDLRNLKLRGAQVRAPEYVDVKMIFVNTDGLSSATETNTQTTPETTDTQTQTNPAVTTTSTQARSAQQNTNIPPTVTNTYSTGGADRQETTREYEE